LNKPLIDLDQIRLGLFGTSDHRRRVATKYDVTIAATAEELESAILKSFGQAELSVDDTAHDNRTIFRAAVRALGSNSRDWRTFMNAEPRLIELTGNYDPQVTASIGATAAPRIQKLIPGQTSGGDARAIVAWAGRLSAVPPYNDFLRSLRDFARKQASVHGILLTGSEITAMVALILGTAPATPFDSLFPVKSPGMGPTLASEFLRNLGWSGFKPDRHVRRLLTLWFPEDQQVRKRAEVLARLIGSRRADVTEFLYFSILGAERSSPGMPISHVDNLVWLYGSMVERARKRTAPS
jgi:hypothetical protein